MSERLVDVSEVAELPGSCRCHGCGSRRAVRRRRHPLGRHRRCDRDERSPGCSRARTEAGGHAASATLTTESDSAAPDGAALEFAAGCIGVVLATKHLRVPAARSRGVSMDSFGWRRAEPHPSGEGSRVYRSRSSRRVHSVANDASRNRRHGAIRAGKPGLGYSQRFRRKKPSIAPSVTASAARITQNALWRPLAGVEHVHPEDAGDERQREHRDADHREQAGARRSGGAR